MNKLINIFNRLFLVIVQKKTNNENKTHELYF